MNLFDKGSGPPLVLVPGIQGRWEWMRPGVEALACHYRVITFSLADEPTSGTVDGRPGFSSYVAQVGEAMDQAGVASATICGMSYGGLIAAAFAARHPERTDALVLISALCPGWRPNARARFYLRAPRLLFPLFAVSSLRLVPEILAAYDGLGRGLAATLRHGWNVATHLPSPGRMARRVRWVDEAGGAPEPRTSGVDDGAPRWALEQLRVPTLIVTGDERLDRVVPPSHTKLYSQLWPHAACEVLSRTGHLGLITRPADLVAALQRFAADATPRTDRLPQDADGTTTVPAVEASSARAPELRVDARPVLVENKSVG